MSALALVSSTEPAWMPESLCRRSDPRLFYPEPGASARPGKAVCDRCPVQPDCLAYAVANEEEFGVWGGLSANQRRQLTPAQRAEILAAVGQEPPQRVCALEDCNEPLGPSRNGNRRYCTPLHSHRANNRRYAARRRELRLRAVS